MAFANVRERQLSPAAQYGAIANRGQAGGINSISNKAMRDAFVKASQDKFFKGRDVGKDRTFRRVAQDTGERQFKNQFTKPVEGSSNLLQMTNDAPRSLAAEKERLANIYGPTLSEIGDDIGFGLGRIAEGFAQKGPPIAQIFRGIGEKFKGGVEQLWDKVRGESPQQVGTAFPQPGLDTKDLFSSINTGIAGSDPNNLLVQIAMANQDRFGDTPTFEEQLANSTVQDFNTLLPQPIQNLQNKINNLGDTKYGKFGLDNLFSGKPTATFNTDVFGGQLGLTANPFSDQYGFQFTKAFKKGGPANKNGGLGFMLK